ncbi:MAG: YraN family protein [Gammaproteobacteria bacterium]
MFSTTTKQNLHTREIGNITEDIALQFLEKNGLLLITKNFNSKMGEIDLIMEEKNTLVFIEVRYRKNTNYGLPEETVGYKKQTKIQKTALLFISKNPRYKNIQPRFDVVAMTPDNKTSGNNMSINWIQNAF